MTFDKVIRDVPFSEMTETELVENEDLHDDEIFLDIGDDLD